MKSDNKTGSQNYIPSRENLTKNELRDDSAKSNDLKMKMEAMSPDMKTDFQSKKTIMNQINQVKNSVRF